METVWQDIRYGIRALARNPGAAVLVLALLGVGIGANTAIFSFVNALYLKAVPARDAGQLVRVYAKRYRFGAGFSYPEYLSLRGHTSTLAGLAAEARVAQLHLVIDGDAQEVQGVFVTANYMPLLGLVPASGRFFLPEEDAAPDRNPVVVISSRLWKAQFGGSATALGREIKVNGISLRVIGVAPAGFGGDQAGEAADVWLPTMMMRSMGYTCNGSFDCSIFDLLIGRLAPGKTSQEAQVELAATVVWSATDAVQEKRQRRLYVLPATGADPDTASEFRSQMQLLLAAAGILLLIACANLAGLFLARGVNRKKEIAVRLSIGASRFRIVRQLMTESLLLALLGAGLGLALSIWGRDLLASFYTLDSEGFVRLYDLSLDWRVVLYSMLLAAVSGMLFGLVPALTACRQDLVVSLKEGGGSGLQRHGWLRQALVCAQIALSLVLLVSAGLLVRSSRTVERGTNFDPRHVVVLRLRPELLHFTPAQNEAYFRQVIQRLESTPGVQSVTMVQGGEGLVWRWDNGRTVQVSLPGRQQPDKDADSGVRYHDVAPNFFETLRIPLLQGRTFTGQDDAAAPRVVVLNQTLAARLWPGESAAGHSLMINGQAARVVGVVADIQPENTLETPSPFVYLPFWQSDPGKNGDIRMAIRLAGDPRTELPVLRRTIRSLNPDVPLGEDMPMTDQVSLDYMPVLLARTVMGYCGVLALGLSAVGLYSVLAFSIRSRTREIGLRMALGARPGQVVRLVLGEGLRLGVMGLAAGVLAAMAATRLLASWLFGVRSLDLWSFAAGNLLLLATAVLASYLPSRRASRVDPVVALRHE